MTHAVNKARKDKRAGLKITLSTLIDLVLVSLALLLLFSIYKGVVGLLGNSDKEQATVRNFQELGDQIKEMQVGSSEEMPIYVELQKFIVGFKRGESIIYPRYCQAVVYNKLITKPAVCGDKPCLCLCDRQSAKDKNACEEGAQCITNFDGDFDFTGSSTGPICSFAVVTGQDKPQTIFIRKRDKEVLICSEECS